MNEDWPWLVDEKRGFCAYPVLLPSRNLGCMKFGVLLLRLVQIVCLYGVIHVN